MLIAGTTRATGGGADVEVGGVGGWPLGLTVTLRGTAATGMVAVTVLVAVSITDTVLSLALVGDVDGAVGAHRHRSGEVPTGMVAVTVLVAVSITDTVFCRSWRRRRCSRRG